MRPILYALIILLAVGCNKDDDDDDDDCGCTIISLDADISIENAAGEDLLDPNRPNSYKKRDIKTSI